MFLLGGCSVLEAVQTSSAPVVQAKCHEFASEDKAKIREAIAALPDNNPLHPVIRDYARVCTTIK